MSVVLNSHSVFTKATATSTTGTVTANASDFILVFTTYSTGMPGSISGGGLTWQLITRVLNGTTIIGELWGATPSAPISSSTITISVATSTIIEGAIFVFSNAGGIGATGLRVQAANTSITQTIITQRNGSLVLAIVKGTTDTVITAPSTQLDADTGGSLISVQAAGSPYTAGTSVTVAATSAGGNVSQDIVFEVVGMKAKFNNSGFRPHPFSPGIAR